ncbi:MAG TPA: hypothetical protein VFS33_08825 [Gemmatimonadales bacterium]|nr:hypothetical protein [Gemmatimonadales bacterium]
MGAAIATILASAHSCGLIGAQSTRLTVANLNVHWVGLSPRTDTARAIGDTLRYVATVTDRRGTALIGSAITWSTGDSTVAVVDSAGFVVARGPGTTTVTVGVGEKVARARVVVRPEPVRLEFGPDSLLVVPEGGTRPIELHAFDARDHELPHGAVRYSVADSSIVVLDSGSALVGRASGRTLLAATLGRRTDSVAVSVVPAPGRLVATKGQGQRIAAGARLSDPVVVRVESRRGHPMAGVMLRGAASDGGSIRPDTLVTSKDGTATVTWTLGEAPGRQRLVFAVAGVDSALTVYAEAEPNAANTRIAAIGEAPSGPAGDGPVLVGVQLTDSLGRVLAGVPVAWTTLDGGSITARSGRSDSLGEARADWILGPRSGVQRVKVVVGAGRAVPAFTLTATALPGEPAALTAVTSTSIEGSAGAPLKRPVVVRVTDAAGNPVPQASLTVSPTAGMVPDSVVATDSAGRATIAWTLGEKAGEQRLVLRVRGLPALEIVAHARPRAAANIAFLDAPTAATAGRELAKPVRVRVTDVYGNPVPQQLVVFQVASGSVNPARIMTAADGIAATRWTPARKAGAQSISATLAGTSTRERLEVEVASGPATARAGSGRRR